MQSIWGSLNMPVECEIWCEKEQLLLRVVSNIPDLLFLLNAPFDEFGAILQAAWFCLLSAFAIIPICTNFYFAEAVYDHADESGGTTL